MQKWVIDELEAMVSEQPGIGSNVLAGPLQKGMSATQLLNTIDSLAEKMNTETAKLQQQFGQRLFLSFIKRNPGQFQQIKTCFELLQQLQTLVGLEGHKLYSDSAPPRFEFLQIEEQKMVMDYVSPRPFGLICSGLIQGCIDYYAEPIELKSQLINGALNHVRFTLTKSGVDAAGRGS